jgi:hypothetical protein
MSIFFVYIVLFLFVAVPVLAVIQLRGVTSPGGRYFSSLAIVFMLGFTIGFPCLAVYTVHRNNVARAHMEQEMNLAVARARAEMLAQAAHQNR